VNDVEYSLPQPLTWRELDGEWLVYQDRTGQVLVLDPVAAMVVGLLEDGASDRSRLATRLAGDLELPDDVDVGAIIDNVLHPLWHAGLVARSDQRPAW
jgi:PqqD family protein of HPr-rel-A system